MHWSLLLRTQTGVAKGDASNHLYPSHPPMWQNLGSLFESEAHKECKYVTRFDEQIPKTSAFKYPLPSEKRKTKLNFVWWLSTLFVCKEINFDRFPSGDISFFCCVVHVHLCVILLLSLSAPKESAPFILNLDPKNATFGTVKTLGMKITEQISFTRNGLSNKSYA